MEDDKKDIEEGLYGKFILNLMCSPLIILGLVVAGYQIVVPEEDNSTKTNRIDLDDVESEPSGGIERAIFFVTHIHVQEHL